MAIRYPSYTPLGTTIVKNIPYRYTLYPQGCNSYPKGCDWSALDRIRTCISIHYLAPFRRRSGYEGVLFLNYRLEFLAFIPPLAAIWASNGFYRFSVINGDWPTVQQAEVR